MKLRLHRAMIIMGLCSFLLLCSGSRTGTAEAQKAHLGFAKTSQDLDSYVQSEMSRRKTRAVAVALVTPSGMVWAKGYGFTDSTMQRAVASKTLFNLQSTSKTVTAIGILLAAEREGLDLDAPYVRVVPEFRIHNRFNEDEFKRITFRQLLSHWAGLPHEAPCGNNFDDGACKFEDHIRSISDSWMIAPAGQRYSYSNVGYDLLAYALQRRSRKPFATYMLDAVFRPLQMPRSTFDRSIALRNGDLALGEQNGKDVTIPVPMVGAGGMYSNVEDLSELLTMLLSSGRFRGKRFLSEQSLSALESLPYPVDHQIGGYALGVNRRDVYGTTMYFHGGGGYGYSIELRWIPTYNIGVVALTTDGDGSLAQDVADRACEGMIRESIGRLPEQAKPPLTDRPTITSPGASAAKFEGTYRAYSSLKTISVRDGQIFFRSGDQETMLVPHEGNELVADDIRLRLRLGPNGYPYQIDYLDRNDVDTLFPNELKEETQGPSRREWQQFVGSYRGFAYVDRFSTSIALKNGYLFSSRGGGLKLIEEFTPGLFFTVSGESVEFHGDKMLLGNRPFQKEQTP